MVWQQIIYFLSLTLSSCDHQKSVQGGFIPSRAPHSLQQSRDGSQSTNSTKPWACRAPSAVGAWLPWHNPRASVENWSLLLPGPYCWQILACSQLSMTTLANLGSSALCFCETGGASACKAPSWKSHPWLQQPQCKALTCSHPTHHCQTTPSSSTHSRLDPPCPSCCQLYITS